MVSLSEHFFLLLHLEFKIKTMELHPIHAGYFSCDGGSLFGVIPKVLWNKVYPANENNIVQLTLRCLLVDLGDRKILGSISRRRCAFNS